MASPVAPRPCKAAALPADAAYFPRRRDRWRRASSRRDGAPRAPCSPAAPVAPAPPRPEPPTLGGRGPLPQIPQAMPQPRPTDVVPSPTRWSPLDPRPRPGALGVRCARQGSRSPRGERRRAAWLPQPLSARPRSPRIVKLSRHRVNTLQILVIWAARAAVAASQGARRTSVSVSVPTRPLVRSPRVPGRGARSSRRGTRRGASGVPDRPRWTTVPSGSRPLGSRRPSTGPHRPDTTPLATHPRATQRVRGPRDGRTSAAAAGERGAPGRGALRHLKGRSLTATRASQLLARNGTRRTLDG